MFKTLRQIIFLNFIFLLTTLTLVHAFEIKETDNKLEVRHNDKIIYTLTGKNSGIRHKKVTVFNVKVYKAQLFFEEAHLPKTNPKELMQTPVKSVKLHPLRSFGGDKLKEALLVSYEKNKIDPESEAQKKFLDLISQHKVEKDQPVYLVGISGKDKDELVITMKDLTKIVNGPKGFANEVFSVWLGDPVDGDMTKLQKTLTE